MVCVSFTECSWVHRPPSSVHWTFLNQSESREMRQSAIGIALVRGYYSEDRPGGRNFGFCGGGNLSPPAGLSSHVARSPVLSGLCFEQMPAQVLTNDCTDR